MKRLIHIIYSIVFSSLAAAVQRAGDYSEALILSKQHGSDIAVLVVGIVISIDIK